MFSVIGSSTFQSFGDLIPQGKFYSSVYHVVLGLVWFQSMLLGSLVPGSTEQLIKKAPSRLSQGLILLSSELRAWESAFITRSPGASEAPS